MCLAGGGGAAVLPKYWKSAARPHCNYPQDSNHHEACFHIVYIFNHTALLSALPFLFVLLVETILLSTNCVCVVAGNPKVFCHHHVCNC